MGRHRKSENDSKSSTMAVDRDVQNTIGSMREKGQTNNDVLRELCVEHIQKYSEPLEILKYQLEDVKSDKETLQHDLIVVLKELRKHTRAIPEGLLTATARKAWD